MLVSLAPMARRRAAMLALCAAFAACAPAPARAGGGAHVVDDDAVLDPGVCHVENWVTLFERGDARLATAAPACTLKVLPGVEWALAAQHTRGDGTATSITPAAKWNLRPAATGIGVAVSAAATVSLDRGRVETVFVNLPVTVPLRENLVVHGNLGWIATPGAGGGDTHALFWGAQAEYFLRRDLVLMGEVFGQDRGPAGAQAGLRWVTDRGRIDVDILAGHNIDGRGAGSVTLGVTIRR